MKSFLAGFAAQTAILLRARAVWLALLALAAGALFSLSAGAARVSAQQEIVARARVEETQRIDGLKRTLQKLESGKLQEDLPPYRDPRNAAFMGAGPAARVAALAPAPLALVAVGQSDLLSPVVRVTSGSKDAFLFADEIENPALLSGGAADLAFLVALVYPLVILALCFDLLASEREQGTLALTLACARQPGAALAGKLAARLVAPIAVTLAASGLGVALFAGVGALLSVGFLQLAAIILVYGVFWGALAAAVDGLGMSAAFNALTLVCAFVAVALIAPAGINSLAAYVHPAPSRIEMTLAARAAATDADKSRDAMLARYVEEHGARPPAGAREGTLRRIATQEAAFERVESVIAAHDAALARQRALVDRLSYLSPTLLVYGALADVAGAGEARHHGFLDRLGAFHLDWRAFFLTRAKAGAAMTLQDYDVLPRFQADAGGEASVAGAIVGVAAPTLLLALLAGRGLRRVTP
jgi:ABC-2 type transport system permease protein